MLVLVERQESLIECAVATSLGYELIVSFSHQLVQLLGKVEEDAMPAMKSQSSIGTTIPDALWVVEE